MPSMSLPANAVPNNSLELLDTSRMAVEPWIGNYPQSTISRIKLIRSSLLEVLPISLVDWLKALSLESSHELLEWERIAASYVEFCTSKELSSLEKSNVLAVLVQLSLCTADAAILEASDLPRARVTEISSIYGRNGAELSTNPLYPEDVGKEVDNSFVRVLKTFFDKRLRGFD